MVQLRGVQGQKKEFSQRGGGGWSVVQILRSVLSKKKNLTYDYLLVIFSPSITFVISSMRW